MSTPAVKPVVNSAEKPPRLPCRGCMPECANYRTCEGLLWRQKPATNV